MRGEPYGLDPETIEQLIRDTTGDIGVDLLRLSELLAAARAPAYPDELTGMDAALTAFRQATPAREALARGTRVIRPALSLKAAAAALGIAALGGGAVAAATGTLPASLTLVHPAATTAPTRTTTASAVPLDGRRTRPGSPPATRAAPSALSGLNGLCNAFNATRNPNDHRLSPLVKAAGGRDKVPAYCAKLAHGRPPGHKGTTGGPPPHAGDQGAPKTPAPAKTPQDQGGHG
jgi:hypothetical protein